MTSYGDEHEHASTLDNGDIEGLSKEPSKQEDEERAVGMSQSSSEGSAQGNGAIPPQVSPQGPPPKVGFFDPTIKNLRWLVAKKFLFNYLVLTILVICSFSLYWGSLYDRTGHLHDLEMLVVIEDDASDITPTIGDSFVTLVNGTFRTSGDWHIVQGSDEINDFFGTYTNLTAEIIEKVHHRKYWTATYIPANATQNQLEYFTGERSAAETSIQYIYETGRDPSGMPFIVKSVLGQITTALVDQVFPALVPKLLSALSQNQLQTLLSSESVVITPVIASLDYRPFYDTTLIAPLQVGLIFLIISSFLIFNFFAQVHMILLPRVKIGQYLLYRTLGNHLSYFIIALFVSVVSAIFQIDFTKSVGKAGFVVFWFSNYLTMAAVGGANENVCILMFAYSPPFMGVWLISFVITNVSPTFSPMALTNVFYRYGYAMPIHQANEIFKVLLLDLWKGELGRCYGILVIWIVLNTLLMPVFLKHAGAVMAKKAAAAKAAAGKAN